VNGEEAVTISENWQPHLIWMDMRMPVMNGYEATQRIKATPQGQDIIIIALTASAFEEERSLILSCGCNDYLRKPFQESVIFEKMAQYLGVEYVYYPKIVKTQSVEILEADGEAIPTDRVIAVQISQMPPEWVAQLHQTASQLNVKRTLKLIEEIPPEYPQLAIALTDWVNGFHFDEIANLTQTINN
jgi:two-component system sensor histidine kinase/response regulator